MDTASIQRRRGRWIPGLIALGALLAIGLVFGAGLDLTHPSPHSLSGKDVAAQIALGIQAEQGTASPPRLSCPSAEPIHRGLTFECTAKGLAAPGERRVEVVEIDDHGHLRWTLGPPSG